jgi:hypothetical protein
MLIGEGLRCVNDIMNGSIDERDVWFIISEFSGGTEDDWGSIIKQNRARLWEEDQIEGARIFWQLFNAGKILQPCPRGLEGKPFSLKSNVWLEIPNRG